MRCAPRNLFAAAITAALAISSVSSADSVSAVSVGGIDKKLGLAKNLNFFNAEAEICIHVRAGDVVDPAKASLDRLCDFRLKDGRLIKDARGRIDSKFDRGNPLPIANAVKDSNTAEKVFNQNQGLTSEGRAEWSSSLLITPEGNNAQVQQQVEADVVRDLSIQGGPARLAIARIKDPIVIEFPEAGSLTYALALTDVGFFSNDPLAEFLFETEAAFSGVMLGGSPLDGPLFALSIQGEGIIDSADDLSILFNPSPLLALSTTEVSAVEAYVKSQLVPRADGSIGFADGRAVDLFGGSGPLPELTLSYGPNAIVSYTDAALTQVSLVPGPPSLVLVLISGLVLAPARCVRRRRVGRPLRASPEA